MKNPEQSPGGRLVADWRSLIEESERRLERFHAILTSGALETKMDEELNVFIKSQSAADIRRRDAITQLAAHADQLSDEERKEMIELHQRSENLSRRSVALMDAVLKATTGST